MWKESAVPRIAVSCFCHGFQLSRWSGKAIKSYAMGELEARKLKYPTTGTEALLLWEHPAKPFKCNGFYVYRGSFPWYSELLWSSASRFVERTVFYREKAAGMYSTLRCAFAQVIIEVPYTFCQTTFYGVIVYAMMGFEWSAAKFFWFIFFLFFTLLYFTYYGMMCVGLTPNASVSAIISSAFYGIWNVFSGFLIPRPRMPVWWRWYYWGCPIAWSLYGFLVSKFGDYEDLLEDVPGDVRVKDFLHSYFGYKRDFLGPVADVILGINLLFAVMYAYSIKAFNFQRR